MRSLFQSSFPRPTTRWNVLTHSLLPVMCVAYITQSLDKGTLGTSAIMGWQTHVGAVGQDYALTSTFLWIGIIVGEPLVNQFCRRLPVAKVLGISMIVWSAVSWRFDIGGKLEAWYILTCVSSFSVSPSVSPSRPCSLSGRCWVYLRVLSHHASLQVSLGRTDGH